MQTDAIPFGIFHGAILGQFVFFGQERWILCSLRMKHVHFHNQVTSSDNRAMRRPELHVHESAAPCRTL
jgi:hypothetical protein